RVLPLAFIMGRVTVYRPNRITGEVLPGVPGVRYCSSRHGSITTLPAMEQRQSAETPLSIPLHVASPVPSRGVPVGSEGWCHANVILRPRRPTHSKRV